MESHTEYIGIIYTKKPAESRIMQYLDSNMDWQTSLIELPADTALIEVSSANHKLPWRPVLHGYWALTNRIPDLLPDDADDLNDRFHTIQAVKQKNLSEPKHLDLGTQTEKFQNNAVIWLSRGLKAKQAGEYEQALEIWLQARPELPEASYAIGSEFIRLASEQRMKPYYEQATGMYFWGLGGGLKTEQNIDAFEEDLLYLKLLMTPGEIEKFPDSEDAYDEERLSAIRLYWENADPLPTTPSNPRLIEHYSRVAEAIEQFPDENSPLGFDDRGKAWVRYGEPDSVFDEDLIPDRGAMMNFISDFFFLVENSGTPCKFSLTASFIGTSDRDEAETGVDVLSLVNLVDDKIRSNTMFSAGEIWSYHRSRINSADNVLLYFRQGKNSVFKETYGLEEYFSPTLFISNQSDCRLANLKSGLVVQYVLYRKLMGFDPFFRNQLERLDTGIFSNAASLSGAAVVNLATHHKAVNQLQ